MKKCTHNFINFTNISDKICLIKHKANLNLLAQYVKTLLLLMITASKNRGADEKLLLDHSNPGVP